MPKLYHTPLGLVVVGNVANIGANVNSPMTLRFHHDPSHPSPLSFLLLYLSTRYYYR